MAPIVVQRGSNMAGAPSRYDPRTIHSGRRRLPPCPSDFPADACAPPRRPAGGAPHAAPAVRLPHRDRRHASCSSTATSGTTSSTARPGSSAATTSRCWSACRPPSSSRATRWSPTRRARSPPSCCSGPRSTARGCGRCRAPAARTTNSTRCAASSTSSRAPRAPRSRAGCASACWSAATCSPTASTRWRWRPTSSPTASGPPSPRCCTACAAPRSSRARPASC